MKLTTNIKHFLFNQQIYVEEIKDFLNSSQEILLNSLREQEINLLFLLETDFKLPYKITKIEAFFESIRYVQNDWLETIDILIFIAEDFINESHNPNNDEKERLQKDFEELNFYIEKSKNCERLKFFPGRQLGWMSNFLNVNLLLNENEQITIIKQYCEW